MMFRRRYFNIAIAVAYVLLLILIVWGLNHVRGWTDETYANTQAQSEWQEFRDAVADAADGGPVSRDVPRSAEPPALVLLRDHFAACVTISLVLSSALFFSFAFFLRGVLPLKTPMD